MHPVQTYNPVTMALSICARASVSLRASWAAAFLIPICLVCMAGPVGAQGVSAAQRTGAWEFLMGADISSLQQIENRGGVYREEGIRRDLLDILKNHGFNSIRLRVWHTPPAGYCGLDSTLIMAGRVKAEGMVLLLDLHYSDTWADPGKQAKPEAWEGLAFHDLKDSVFEYTRSVFCRMKDLGMLPDMVQLGNEITCGMLWDDGRVCGGFDGPGRWKNLAELLAAGLEGMDAALGPGDSVRVMLHIDRGADMTGGLRFYDRILAEGIDFDLMGLSYYPWWHGTLDGVEATLDTLARRYEKDIIIVETAYPWTLDWYDDTHNLVGLPEHIHPGYPATPAGQEAFLSDLIEIVAGTYAGRGRGVFYWAPEFIAVTGLGSPWENLTLFDFEGNLLPSISAFQRRAETGGGAESTHNPYAPSRIRPVD